jgi:drug/metabolite transporter (DMT)-like permease
MMMTHLFNPTNKAKIFLYYGVVALSMGSIFARWLGQELSPQAIVFNRLLLGIPIFGLGYFKTWRFPLWATDPKIQDRSVQPIYTYPDIGYLIGAGVGFALSLTLLALSITQTNIATASVLHNLSPIFTGLGLWILFGQTLCPKFIIGMGMTLFGMGLVEWGEFQASPDSLWGDVEAVLSSIFLAFYFICIEQTRSKFSAVTVQIWVCSFGALTLFPFLIFTHDRLFPVSSQGWLMILALTLTCQLIGQGMLTYSLKQLSSVLVSLIHLLDPVFSGIFAWLIFKESLGFAHVGGLIIILIGLSLSITGHTESSQAKFV